jgi:hypothetical protein
MFEKISCVAEKLAADVSRRRFLGRLGQGAVVVAGVVGGLLAVPAVALADPKGTCHPRCHRGEVCVTCFLFGGPWFCCPVGVDCCRTTQPAHQR